MRRHGIRHPARLVPLAFFFAVMVGTGLLSLPFARAGEGSAPLVTALFTATSAVCVTGMTVVDTPVYWSAFGQGVILSLIQIGGFGIMTGATLLGLLVLRRLGLGTRLVVQAEARSLVPGDLLSVLRMIVIATLVTEAIATVVLALRLHYGEGEPWPQAWWNGLFHAVSAFNSAGFSTYSIGLRRFAHDAWILVPLMIAALLGGLGFPVLLEIWRERLSWRTWSVHTRLTLVGTGLMIAGGGLLVGMYEWNNPATFGALPLGERLVGLAFHAVASRTSGFDVVSIADLRPETWSVTYVLMLVGGGSASTAGGIKVTTFFLLGLVVWSEVRGVPDTHAFGRRIPVAVQRQALAVVLLALTVLAALTLALMTLTDLPLAVVLFEAISAFATNGLSTGATATMPPSAQALLAAAMFLGRVGTITVATALALRRSQRAYRYPEESPIVG